ncbi:hypothetical protein BT69DRAFT_789671 [Atractiella rhizophila]|nr:hypothetical protein BT69DRAFT_789671 [Atractiella rhizophila]
MLDRAVKLLYESDIFNYATVESMSILLEIAVLFNSADRKTESLEFQRQALAQFRIAVQDPSFPEHARCNLGSWLIFTDAFLARNLQIPHGVTDEEIVSTMFYPNIDPRLFTNPQALLTLPPNFNHPERDIVLAFGGTGFMRGTGKLFYNARHAPDQAQAARGFAIALKLVFTRKQWLADHRKSRVVPTIGPAERADSEVWQYHDLNEFPLHIFQAMSYLEEYLQEQRVITSPELLQVVNVYNREVDNTIALVSAWLKENLLESTLVAGTHGARRHMMICRTFSLLPGKYQYLLRYLTSQTPTGADRRDVIFWIAQALKPGAFFNPEWSLWATQLTNYLEHFPPPTLLQNSNNQLSSDYLRQPTGWTPPTTLFKTASPQFNVIEPSDTLSQGDTSSVSLELLAGEIVSQALASISQGVA